MSARWGNTAERLEELAQEFRARSEAKHAEHGLAGYAQIVHHAPRMAWRAERGQLVRALSVQSWQIVYVDGAGRWTHGVEIGRTRAGAILWLLAQRKAWPL